jgi:hypothetical protein
MKHLKGLSNRECFAAGAEVVLALAGASGVSKAHVDSLALVVTLLCRLRDDRLDKTLKAVNTMRPEIVAVIDQIKRAGETKATDETKEQPE